MGKYVFAYRGGEGMASTEEEQRAVMAAWMAWFEQLGEVVVDGGNPFGASTTVTGSGAEGVGRAGLGGYSIVSAGSLAEAADHAKGCPALANGGTVGGVRSARDVTGGSGCGSGPRMLLRRGQAGAGSRRTMAHDPDDGDPDPTADSRRRPVEAGHPGPVLGFDGGGATRRARRMRRPSRLCRRVRRPAWPVCCSMSTARASERS
ncbi:MAG: YciI family protein [Nocardioides sp.]